jgi:hypothetical protein
MVQSMLISLFASLAPMIGTLIVETGGEKNQTAVNAGRVDFFWLTFIVQFS